MTKCQMSNQNLSVRGIKSNYVTCLCKGYEGKVLLSFSTVTSKAPQRISVILFGHLVTQGNT